MKENTPTTHIQKDEAIHAALTGTMIGIGIGSIIAINTPLILGVGIVALGIHESRKGIEHIVRREEFIKT